MQVIKEQRQKIGVGGGKYYRTEFSLLIYPFYFYSVIISYNTQNI